MLINLEIETAAEQFLIFIGLTVGILLVSFALAGIMCRKKCGSVRFSVWMAIWILLTTNIFFIGVALIRASMSTISLAMMLLQVLMVGFIYGGILIAALLPFEILLFVNSFWCRRFEAVFGLKTKKDTIEAQTESQIPVNE